jgi:hypothetical protein
MRPIISGTIASDSARVIDHLPYSSAIASPFYEIYDTHEHVYFQ